MNKNLKLRIDQAVWDFEKRHGKLPGRILVGRKVEGYRDALPGNRLAFLVGANEEIPVDVVDGDQISLMPPFIPKPATCPDCSIAWNARGVCSTMGCAYSYSFVTWDVNKGSWGYDGKLVIEKPREVAKVPCLWCGTQLSPAGQCTSLNCDLGPAKTMAKELETPLSRVKLFLNHPRLVSALEVGAIAASFSLLGQFLARFV